MHQGIRPLRTLLYTILLPIICFPILCSADHANEGPVSIEQLLKEANLQNTELKEANFQISSLTSEIEAKKSSYHPKISIEGGPQSITLNQENNSGTSVYGKLEWNLYKGGITPHQIQKTEIILDIQKRKSEGIKNKIYRNIYQVYYELLFLLESKDLKEKSIQMNQDQMKLAKRKKDSGLTSKADVLEFELREATLNSDLKWLDQQISEKSKSLSQMIGRNNNNLPLLAHGHLRKETLSFNKESILAKVRSNNLEIQESRAEAESSQKEIAIAKTGYLPSVDLEGKYGKLANDEKIFAGENNFSVLLKVSIPLYSGLESKHTVLAASSMASAKEILASRKLNSISTDAEILLDQLSIISERLNLEELNLSKSEEYYKITKEEYNRGVKNSPDIVLASERLLDAKIRNLEFRRDFQLTKIKLAELTGEDPTNISK